MKNSYLKCLEQIKKIDIEKLENRQKLKYIFLFIKNFEEIYPGIIDKLENSKVRFMDYYSNTIHQSNIIDSFNNDYINNDIEDQKPLYILYVILKNISDLIEAFDVYGIEEIDDIVELESEVIEDLTFLTLEFQKIMELNKEQTLDFENNKYKIFFSGYSYEDITSHEKFVVKSVINKLNNSLSTEDIVSGAQGIGHVRDKYNVPLLRVQVADDYRITFIRNNNVTIILGIELKTGKDSNYTRYDNIAKKIDDIFKESQMFLEAKLNQNHVHYKVMEYIKDFEQKRNKKLANAA